ncbi:hypothetical protein Q5530_13080 [Saccharothrix sp. BKS2]|uniref:hypothetical protein n=1 Tax=Saccharothrix sp. BKS2 TaxID=3064400 RepID=UPI0039E90715
MLAALAGRVPPREARDLRREALDQVAAEHGWRRAEALRAVAPHLDHDSRLTALALLAGVDRDGPTRWRRWSRA